MKLFYKWRYKVHQKKAMIYMNQNLYPTIYEYHIEKTRYYAVKLGWKF